jgi:hypothetical protein
MLKTPLNELGPIWPLNTLLSPKELIKLKKFKHRYYLWKKYYGKNNERVSEWNTRAREIYARKNKIESSIDPYTIWFKPTMGEFSVKVVFEEHAKGRIVSGFAGPSRHKVVYEQGVSVKDTGEPYRP